MGFRNGSYATVWSVESISDTNTKVRISISRKNKQTDEYEQEFSGYVNFYGTAIAKKAACLKEKDRIKLGDVDVTTKYNAEKKVTYTNYKCFSFEVVDDSPDKSEGEAESFAADTVNEENENKLPF